MYVCGAAVRAGSEMGMMRHRICSWFQDVKHTQVRRNIAPRSHSSPCDSASPNLTVISVCILAQTRE
jgi:hypothetical protein